MLLLILNPLYPVIASPSPRVILVSRSPECSERGSEESHTDQDELRAAISQFPPTSGIASALCALQ